MKIRSAALAYSLSLQIIAYPTPERNKAISPFEMTPAGTPLTGKTFGDLNENPRSAVSMAAREASESFTKLSARRIKSTENMRIKRSTVTGDGDSLPNLSTGPINNLSGAANGGKLIISANELNRNIDDEEDDNLGETEGQINADDRNKDDDIHKDSEKFQKSGPLVSSQFEVGKGEAKFSSKNFLEANTNSFDKNNQGLAGIRDNLSAPSARKPNGIENAGHATEDAEFFRREAGENEAKEVKSNDKNDDKVEKQDEKESKLGSISRKTNTLVNNTQSFLEKHTGISLGSSNKDSDDDEDSDEKDSDKKGSAVESKPKEKSIFGKIKGYFSSSD